MQLKITQEGEYVAEAFGWKEKDFEKLTNAMKKHNGSTIIKVLESKNEDDCPSKVDLLESFLASREFKKLNLKIETANDYFVLGYAFHATSKQIESIMKTFVIKHLLGHVIEGL